ncbi:MAG: hypothetical protein WC852_00845 [Candidatus Nanoarchaeia archaeon]|jgi:hypothetical protein
MRLIGNQTLIELVTEDRKKLAAVRRYAREYRWPERKLIEEHLSRDYELVIKLVYPRGEFVTESDRRCSCGGNRIAINPGIAYTKPDGTQRTRIFGFPTPPRTMATLCMECNKFHDLYEEYEERELTPYD